MQKLADVIFSAQKGLALDLFLPDKEPRAIVLYLHGGGFTRGSRKGDQSKQLLQKLLGADLGVAFADYRLGVGADAFSDAQAAAIAAMQVRTKAVGLTVASGLAGPAMIAALEDASDAVQALKSGNLCGVTKGLPVVILGVSAGGIAGLSLAYPPSEWSAASHRPMALWPFAPRWFSLGACIRMAHRRSCCTAPLIESSIPPTLVWSRGGRQDLGHRCVWKYQLFGAITAR